MAKDLTVRVSERSDGPWLDTERPMRLRTEWITIFTVTSLAICAVVLPKRATTSPSDARRNHVVAAGIDPTPTGTIKSAKMARPVRRRQP